MTHGGLSGVKIVKGALALFAQAAATLTADCLLTALIWLAGPWYAIGAWGGMPLVGLLSAYWAARHGVNNYLAWLAPPLGVFFAHLIVTGYAPDQPGPTMLAALLAIVGAAAGYVVNHTKR